MPQTLIVPNQTASFSFTDSAAAPTTSAGAGGRASYRFIEYFTATIRTLFDFLVTGQIVPMNPAASVRGPKIVVRKGKTPVLSAEQTGQLLESIPTDSLVGLRGRALIGVLAYSS